uniref:Protein Wnt n=1 Tax=Salmo trutta TaxID=8032 RepID=A0A674CR17_SALTR
MSLFRFGRGVIWVGILCPFFYVFVFLCFGLVWLSIRDSCTSASQSCRQLQGLVSSQRQLCRSHLELMPTVINTAQQVKRICQDTFSDMRWNCSSAGFPYALSAPALSHALSQSCSTGALRSCSCGVNPSSSSEPALRWGGCPNNLHYGLHMGATFPDTPMKAKRSRPQASTLMHCHNSEVGRKALSEALQVVCKCHNVSGSCSVRTCWRGLQDLKLVAKALKTKYLSATKVIPRSVGVRTQLVPRDIGIRPIRDSELVYLQSSPRLLYMTKFGNLQCNETSSGSDSCDLMCCGRDHSPYTEWLVEKCHSRFHWCCYVSCRTCHRTVERHICM